MSLSFHATHSFLNQASSRCGHNLSEFVACAYLDEVKSDAGRGFHSSVEFETKTYHNQMDIILFYKP